MNTTICGIAFLLATIGQSSTASPASPPSASALRDAAKQVLAQLDGEVKLPGLVEPVEILRDRWGIPHIYARNQHDLFFAQGYVAAQDRLFQLDLWRRISVGETSAILG